MFVDCQALIRLLQNTYTPHQGNNSTGTGRKEMFYLTTHSTHFIYGYMASDIWLRTILIARKETRCHHIGYSLRLTARVLLYAPSHRQDSTYHGLCYTSQEEKCIPGRFINFTQTNNFIDYTFFYQGQQLCILLFRLGK